MRANSTMRAAAFPHEEASSVQEFIRARQRPIWWRKVHGESKYTARVHNIIGQSRDLSAASVEKAGKGWDWKVYGPSSAKPQRVVASGTGAKTAAKAKLFCEAAMRIEMNDQTGELVLLDSKDSKR